MITERIDRRAFLGLAGGAGIAAALSGCSSSYDVAGGFAGPASGNGGKTLVYWNLLSGGDGAHMQAMEEIYRKQNPDVTLNSTVLQWGNPYYTKLALATQTGSPPDVAIMHLSRLPQFAPPGLLTPYDLDVLAGHGMHPSDFLPLAYRKAHYNGRLVALPLDSTPFVMYTNTTICHKAGVLDSSGNLPALTSPAQLIDVLRKIKKTGATPLLCDSVNDQATCWRLFFALYSQLGGSVLSDNGAKITIDRAKAVRAMTVISDLVKEGLIQCNVDGPGAVAGFAGDDVGIMWNGEWQVIPIQQAGIKFSMQPFPALLGPTTTWTDTQAFVIPKQPRHDPEKVSLTLQLVKTLLENSILWADGGHIPAWTPVRDSPAYRKLKPQTNYESVAETATYDPDAWYGGAGSNMENACGGPMSLVMIGAATPEAAYRSMRSQLLTLSKETSPV